MARNASAVGRNSDALSACCVQLRPRLRVAHARSLEVEARLLRNGVERRVGVDSGARVPVDDQIEDGDQMRVAEAVQKVKLAKRHVPLFVVPARNDLEGNETLIAGAFGQKDGAVRALADEALDLVGLAKRRKEGVGRVGPPLLHLLPQTAIA